MFGSTTGKAVLVTLIGLLLTIMVSVPLPVVICKGIVPQMLAQVCSLAFAARRTCAVTNKKQLAAIRISAITDAIKSQV